jgi:hypothetical protein
MPAKTAKTRARIQKLDLRQDLKHLYNPSARQVSVVDVPALNFLMLDGAIEPGQTPGTSPAFGEAFGALYGVGYTLKFMSKLRAENPIEYPMMPLEGLWWTEAGGADWQTNVDWRWTLMVMVPDHITPAMFAAAVDQLRARKNPPGLDRLRLERWAEGPAVQIMHLGPYSAEKPTVDRLHAFAADHGFALRGKHHEIYLGDPRRAKPEKLKTVLRHPVDKITL